MVKMIDIARRAGVSVATVSRVINRPEIVDPAKRELVLQIIQETGFRPNVLAQGLVNQSSKTVGVVINQFSSSYYGRMLDGVEESLADRKFKTIAESSRETGPGELGAVASLHDRQCEGVILHSDKLTTERLTALLDEHPNLILMNRPIDGYENRSVYIDNYQIGHLAGTYLLSKGHREIALVTGPMAFFECRHRLNGFKDALKAGGAELDSELIVDGEFRVDGGFAAMEKLLISGRPISAVFFMNDEMAAGAVDMCMQNGISIPDQISILGCDDLNLAGFMHPKLTTLRQPLRELGNAAGELAHAVATKSDTSNIKRVFQAEVVERASVISVNL